MSNSYDPTDCSPPGFSIPGISQARILKWVAISFCRVSSRPRNQIQVFCIAGRLFTNWATREAQKLVTSGPSHFCKTGVSLGTSRPRHSQIRRPSWSSLSFRHPPTSLTQLCTLTFRTWSPKNAEIGLVAAYSRASPRTRWGLALKSNPLKRCGPIRMLGRGLAQR